MAQLTPKRRSQLMEALLLRMQRASQFRGNRTGGEAALRLGTQYLNKRRYDKLAEEEKAAGKTRGASEAALLAAMQEGGPQLDFQGRPVTDAAGTPQTADPQAQLTQLLTQHPDSDIGRMAAQLQLQSAYAKPDPVKQSFGGGFGTATEDIIGPDGEVVKREGEEFKYWTIQNPVSGEVRHGITTKQGPVEVGGDQFRDRTQRTQDTTDLGSGKKDQVALDQAELAEDMRVTGELLKMDPDEFLTYRGKVKRGVGNFLNKAELTSDEYEDWLAQSQRFYGMTERVFQGIRREVTGAQAAFIELEVLQQAFISNKMAPAQWRSALELIGEMQNSVQRINKSLITEGYDPSNKELWREEVGRRIDAEYAGRLRQLNGMIDSQNDMQSEIDSLPD